MAGNYTSMMEYSPILGTMLTAQDQAQNRQTEFIRQRELEQLISARSAEAEQKAQMNPLELEAKRLGNRGLEAGLPGIAAESRLRGINADKAAGTLASDILAGNAKNESSVAEDRLKTQDRQESFYIAAGSAANDLPAPYRMNGIIQAMKQHGIDPTSGPAQEQLRRLSNMDPEKYPGYFKSLAERHGRTKALQTPSFLQSADNNVSQEKIAKGNNATSIRVAEIGAESRKQVAKERVGKAQDLLTAVRTGKLSAEKAMVAFEWEARIATDPEQKALFEDMAKQAEQYLYNKPLPGKEGDVTLDTENGGLKNKQPPKPQYGGAKLGTAANPIKLD